MTSRTISIHADELEYTAEGLRTRQWLPLEVGVDNRVEIIRPTRVRNVPLGRGGFPHDSSFPTPVALAVLISPSLRTLFETDNRPIYQLYGHAQAEGSEAHNKRLSDRRAEVMRAMLVGDVDGVNAIAEEESWAAAQQQVMLRVLHCDPGPIDGELGPLSNVATRDFQEDYLDGIFHRHVDATPRDRQLSADGVLGPKTGKALIDAFVTACSPKIDPAQLHPSHPTVGCSEFNLLPDEEPNAVAHRRITLLTYDRLPQFHDRAPCVEGDHSACPVDDERPQRCLWYRSHVDDLPEEGPHLHLDLRWLPLAGGRVLLSALTTLEDDEAVEFRVYRSQAIGGPEEIGVARIDEPLSEALAGTVRMGVAQVIWKPEEGYDPFDFDAWYSAFDYEVLARDPMAAWGEQGRLRPPLFVVQGGEATAISEPPGQQLHRMRLTFEDGASASEGKSAWGLDSYGRALHTELEGRRPRTEIRATDERLGVMHFEAIHYRPARRDEG